MNKNILITTLTFIIILLTPLSAEAQFFKFLKKKKPKTEKKEEVKKSKYEKILTDKKCETQESPFISLHKTDGKIYFDLPIDNLNSDMLVSSTISSVSNTNLGVTGFKNSNPLHIRFVQNDSSIVMRVINTNFIHDSSDTSLAKSVELNYGNISLYSFKIEGYNKDSTSVLFDMSSFFLKENKFFPVIGDTFGKYTINSSPKENLSHIAEIKAFENNVILKIDKSFIISLSSRNSTPIENYPVTMQSVYTFVKLPENPMTPRMSDSRVGVFQTRKMEMDPDSKEIKTLNLVKRWRVEPADTDAFLAGSLSDPVKPIIFYVDSTFPDAWKDPIKKGIVRWNKAFEKIGFKNVIQAKDYPVNDLNFDPDNLKYSCIRYVPTSEENAMGPSWIDPRTGEIVNGSVFIYNNVLKLIHNWRFIQTAQIDPKVRGKYISKDLIDESLEYVVAHEVGHTLGFMHNMASSAAYPVDSLRSSSFTKKYGTTPSIMDYARYNYVAQPEDKGVSLSPPFLGLYDYYLVEWTYKHFPELNNDFRAEAKELSKLVESHAGDPYYRYVMQQIYQDKRFDPSAIEEDLGDDPIKASNYGLKNLEYIIPNIDKWVEDDEDSKRKTELYQEAALQAYRYASNVFINVGGIYMNQSSESSGLPRYEVVPKEKQRESVTWLFEKALDFRNIGNEDLEKKLFASNKPFRYMEDFVQTMAIGGLQRVNLAFYLDSTSYSPIEYCQDVFDNVFEKTIRGVENLTEAEMNLQKKYVSYVKPHVVASGGAGSKSITSLEEPFLHSNQTYCSYDAYFIDNSSDNLQLNFQPKISPILKGVDQLSGFSPKQAGFGDGYGVPTDIWIDSVNKSSDYLFYYSEETINLLERASRITRNKDLKLHYSYLLNQLRNAKK